MKKKVTITLSFELIKRIDDLGLAKSTFLESIARQVFGMPEYGDEEGARRRRLYLKPKDL